MESYWDINSEAIEELKKKLFKDEEVKNTLEDLVESILSSIVRAHDNIVSREVEKGLKEYASDLFFHLRADGKIRVILDNGNIFADYDPRKILFEAGYKDYSNEFLDKWSGILRKIASDLEKLK